jgi:hypothetical protein
MKTLGIIDILQLYGFDAEKMRVKIVRHKEDKQGGQISG